MKLLKKYPDEALALVDKSALESAGIECCLYDQQTASIMPHINFASGGVRLMVAESQFDEAGKLLEIDLSENTLENTCPQCKSENVKTSYESRLIVSFLSFLLLVVFLLPAGRKKYLEAYHCQDCAHTWRYPVGTLYIAGVLVILVILILVAFAFSF